MSTKWNDYRNQFDRLPLLKKGESKDIRIIDDSYVIIKMIPSLYSYTMNRSQVIDGSEVLRLKSSMILWKVLENAGIKTSIVHVGDDYYISKRLVFNNRDYCPPVEVIVKARHIGTPKHNLYRIEHELTRFNNRIVPNASHPPYVRFDYTNPLLDDKGNRLKDECIPSSLANYFIDVNSAEKTALSAFSCLYDYLKERSIRLDDICFKIDVTGEVIFGEISPDCMRAVYVDAEQDFFHAEGTKTSKDAFRAGSSPEIILEKYQQFHELISVHSESQS